MKFIFENGKKVDIELWTKINEKLMQDLIEISSSDRCVSFKIVQKYVEDLFAKLDTIDYVGNREMLFLAFEDPKTMPADARVDFVYRPTYIVSTILMTIAVRYPEIWKENNFKSVLSKLLNACTGRSFLGAGYESVPGLLETLRIFAIGDTLKFVQKYSDVSEKFTAQLAKAITFLETEVCTGKEKNAWTGKDYSEKGKEILEMMALAEESNNDYVWYACYGSNISRSRFMKYINRCSDKTPPIEDRPYEFKHNIYFSKKAANWEGCGKAFLDYSTAGHAYGRIYKITREQFEKIKILEGRDYSYKLDLGIIEHVPVYSFTDEKRDDKDRMPSDEYYSVILSGLKECYLGLLEEKEIVNYLNSKIMTEEAFNVVKKIRENPHYITNAEIKEKTGLEECKVIEAVAWLKDHEVIQQDTRSIRKGHEVSDMKAFFYTKNSASGRKLIKVMMDAEADSTISENEESVESGLEGNRRITVSQRIERNIKNRIAAINAHGYKCQACGFDFEKTYGSWGRNYIEVHHINPLSEQNEERAVDPVTEMACLCSNCHSMIHRKRNHTLSIEELQQILK